MKIIHLIEKDLGLREVLDMFKKKKVDMDILTAAGEKYFSNCLAELEKYR